MKILVTGSNGFVGKHLCAILNDHEVTQLDIGGYHRPRPSKFDGIIHLAAIARVGLGEKDPVQCMATNILGTAEMLQIPHDWFIFTSTCEPPRNVYGLSKQCAEDYIRLRDPKHIILRLTNVYGADMQQDKLLPAVKRGENVEWKNVLPFEHIHVDEVCRQIARLIPTFSGPDFRSFTMKLANGIARTPEELRNVAASY